MTSEVTVKAHCAASKEVVALISNAVGVLEKVALQDGETRTFVIYDDRQIAVIESEKTLSETPPSLMTRVANFFAPKADNVDANGNGIPDAEEKAPRYHSPDTIAAAGIQGGMSADEIESRLAAVYRARGE